MNKLYLLCALFLIPLYVSAQDKMIKGTILDADSHEPLVAVNLQITGTYYGTITNDNGAFSLVVESFPAQIEITYIGYEKKLISFNKAPQKDVFITLKPHYLEGEAIVVVAEDPAMGIMRKVIENKQKWRKALNTYQAEAYTRISLSSDTAIASISESISNVFWHKELGSREIITSQRETKNMKMASNFAFSYNIENFYDDEINIMGFKIVGPTHPEAFDFYDFKLKKLTSFGTDTAFVISVIPSAILEPTFVGEIVVLDKAYALIAVDLKPNPEKIFFPMPIREWDIHYTQQFRNFGKEFYLPVDIHAKGRIKVSFPGLDFPYIRYVRSAKMNAYKVNITLPDSLYKEEKVVRVDSASVNKKEQFAHNTDIIPLTKEELKAYETIDSTDSIKRAFKPTGMLADYILRDDEDFNAPDTSLFAKITKGFRPDVNYNRVEGAHLGLIYKRNLGKKWGMSTGLAYKTHLKKTGYHLGLEYRINPKKFFYISGAYFVGSDRTYLTNNTPFFLSAIHTLVGEPDPHDHFWNRSLAFNLRYYHRPWRVEGNVSLMHEKHTSLTNKVSHYALFNRKVTQRLNPRIDAGTYNAAHFQIGWGETEVTYGVAGTRGVLLGLEWSNKAFGSDFNFAKYDIMVNYYFNTFLQRRMIPNAMHLKFYATKSVGDVPLQKLSALDGNVLNHISFFGSFKTLKAQPYIGEDRLALFWEHNFRSIPFELLGLNWFAEKNVGLLVNGGHGRTWLSDKNRAKLGYEPNMAGKGHHEVGASINGIFDFLRIDWAYRIDKPEHYIGVSLFRWY